MARDELVMQAAWTELSRFLYWADSERLPSE